MKVNKAAHKFDFIGQNGKILKTAFLSNNAFYKITKEDSYVRTVITFEDSTKFFLNPVFKYTGVSSDYSKAAIVDVTKTITIRILLIGILIGIIYIFFKRKKSGVVENVNRNMI